MASSIHIKSIKEVAQRYFSEYIESHGDGEHEVTLLSHTEWVGIVGEHVARHAKPLYIQSGILFVQADHATWSHYVRLKSNVIISILNRVKKGVDVQTIKFKSK